jgi:AcrR family transcriptional regulator
MTKPPLRTKKRDSYHHGNLKEALVGAARALIAERGTTGFTLVDAARRAGVSPAAPYRHFPDRDGLIAEVCRRGFAEFGRRLGGAWRNTGADRAEAFRRMGHAYLDFAREEPGYYAAMFTAGAQWTVPTKEPEGGDAFATLVDAIGVATDGKRGNGVDLRRLAFQVWAFSHGIATLSGAPWLVHAFPDIDPAMALDEGVDALIRGTLHSGPPKEDAKRPRSRKTAGANASRT